MTRDGNVAVVTGASRGIGKQTCILLAQRGVHLVLAARTEAPRPGTRMANVIAQEGLPHRIAVVTVEPGFVLTETMAATFAQTGVSDTDAIPPMVPASAIAYLCTCDDPMRYTGQIVSGPALVEELGL